MIAGGLQLSSSSTYYEIICYDSVDVFLWQK